MIGHLSCLHWRLRKGFYLVAIGGGGCTLELYIITSCEGRARQIGRKVGICNFNYVQNTALSS